MKNDKNSFVFNACVFGFATLISVLRLEFLFAFISAVFSITFTLITILTKPANIKTAEIISAGESIETCN